MASYGRHYYGYEPPSRWSGLGSAFFSSVSAFTGIFLLLTFFSVGIAAGIFYLAELAEENTQLTRKIIRILIKIITALYVMVLIVDGLPFFCILFGVAAHILYYQLLRTYPFVDLNSYEFLGACGVGLLSNFLWIRFFWQDPRCAYVSVEWATGFMVVMAFLVPFLFIISLTTTSQGLPTVFGDPSEQSKATRNRPAAAILSLFRLVTRNRNQVLPTVIAQQTFTTTTSHRR